MKNFLKLKPQLMIILLALTSFSGEKVAADCDINQALGLLAPRVHNPCKSWPIFEGTPRPDLQCVRCVRSLATACQPRMTNDQYKDELAKCNFPNKH